MKTKLKIASVLSALLLSTGLVAQEQPTEPAFATKPKVWKETEQKKIKSDFTYIQMETSSMDYDDNFQIIPSISIGRRFASNGPAAADISVSAAFRESDEQKVSHYHLPKLMYVHYINPAKNNSFYVGTGLSWMGIYKDGKAGDVEDVDADAPIATVANDHKFWGMAGNASIGYEFGRKDSVRRMVQLDVSQPFLSAIKEGEFPKPIVELSFGLGF